MGISRKPKLDNAAFYRQVLRTLNASRVPYLVGGGYAFAVYCGIRRQTRDLDLFVRRADYERLAHVLRGAGFEPEMTFSHWLGKVHVGDSYVDLIFSSGNGVAQVDDEWFLHASDANVLGVRVKISPAEEMIWSKAFVMERERFDGADVAHLLLARGDRLDWHRLLRRFGPHWRVLLSHITLFGFVFPAERARVPAWVTDELLDRLRSEGHAPSPQERVCGGTLLSRAQYLTDLQQGCADARVDHGGMTPHEVAQWTDAIPQEQKAQQQAGAGPAA